MARHLGIDVGGGGARWQLNEAGAPPRRGAASTFSGHLFRPDMREAARASLAAIAAEAGPADAIVAGVTGLTAATPEAETLRAMLADAFSAQNIAVMSDSRLAYLSAFAPGEGILVYAGTGSVASHVSADGTFTLVGGKGVIIDDAGGGYWIAVQGLRSLLRREDESPGSAWGTPLGRAFARRIGGSQWPSVREAVYGGTRGDIGRLATAVGEAAEEGDAAAVAILQAAGRELAALAMAMERRIGRRPTVLTGGAARLHPAIGAAFLARLVGWDAALGAFDAAAKAAEFAASPSFFEDLLRKATD